MKPIYFDTSSINYVNDYVKQSELKHLRQRFINELGGLPTISPLNLYEILNSANTEKREELILTCQTFFTENIFPSPCEILGRYLYLHTPLIENGKLELTSVSDIAKTWSEISSNPHKTIIVDPVQIKDYKDFLYKQSRILYDAIKNNFSTKSTDENYILTISSVEKLYEDLFPYISTQDIITPEKELLYKTNIFFICQVLIFMDAPFNNLTEFWGKRKIYSIEGKLNYIFNDSPLLLFRGPTILMSMMAINQANAKFQRGFLFDCLHSCYCSYCDYFVSNDEHFRSFANSISELLPCEFISIHLFNEQTNTN